MKHLLIISALILASSIAGCQSAPSGEAEHARIVALAASGTPAVHLWISGFA